MPFAAILIVLLLLLAGPAQAQGRMIEFVGVSLDDEGTAKADQRLCEIMSSPGALVEPRSGATSYAEAIRTVVGGFGGDCVEYVARLTPYACVVAELRGARFTILATYVSAATDARTYRAYFVVNRNGFLDKPEPTLSELLEHMRGFNARAESRRSRGEPAEKPLRFVYHDQYSTSSFFLPSLVFREHRLFTAGAPTSCAPFTATRHGTSSLGLIHAVAAGEADLAAVWDGTKSSAQERAPDDFAKVAFIPIDMVVPNDLLVCAKCMSGPDKARLRRAVVDKKIALGDFKEWTLWDAASDARTSYSALRRRAAERPASVLVEVSENHAPMEWREAAKQAIRLSGTEFVVHDDDSEEQRIDVKWDLDVIHDGAIRLRTAIVDVGLRQEFTISFDGREDLTRRIAGIIHSGMHRFRYVWPYERTKPTIIRDIDFPVAVGDEAFVQRIAWQQGALSGFADRHFPARVADADYHAIQIESPEFTKVGDEYAFDPMSEVSYRVILKRPDTEDPLVRWFTIGIVVLAASCAAAAIYDLRRGKAARRDTPKAASRATRDVELPTGRGR